MTTQALLQPLASCGRCSFTASQRFTRQTYCANNALRRQCKSPYGAPRTSRRVHLARAEDKSRTETKEEELPPWIRSERERKMQTEEGSDLPFPVYLIGSALVAIAAVGSIFEYANRNPIFGVVKPDNFLWAPILLFFAITGFPSAGFLFIKAINAANKDAERQDKIDGY
ncbi:g6161 [Coccomyxa viridis]|uniref:G6161 protein n=1 Tax=Coccomyxa viridis TaxID=1274662 RepID=A0ABP1FYN2_9CHLO